MADGDANEQDVVPSGGPDGGRSRRLLWAGLGLLLVGVAVGVVVVLAFGGGDDSAPKVAVEDKALVPTSTTAPTATTTTRTTTTTTTGGSSPTPATAASGAGGGTSGGGATPTSPPATPATDAPSTPTSEASPALVSASVEPNFVVCPKFGGEAVVTVTWATTNANGVEILIHGVDGNTVGRYSGLTSQGSRSVTLGCNGMQQKLTIVPVRGIDSDDAIRGADSAVFVNEGIEGT